MLQSEDEGKWTSTKKTSKKETIENVENVDTIDTAEKKKMERQVAERNRLLSTRTKAQILKRYYHPPTGSRFEVLRELYSES